MMWAENGTSPPTSTNDAINNNAVRVIATMLPPNPGDAEHHGDLA